MTDMKVKVTYTVSVEKDFEMTPETYCNYRTRFASMREAGIIPIDAWGIDVEPATDKDRAELDEFYFSKKTKTFFSCILLPVFYQS